MADRPYTLLSCGMSLDGYLDSPVRSRLALSNDEDFARVDRVRAGCDAILVGAETIRADDPRLLVRSAALRAERINRGLAATPAKVTLTSTGRLDRGSRFFACGGSEKLVYCPDALAGELEERLGGAAVVIGCDGGVVVGELTADLHRRGIRRLMVEGGGSVHTQFLSSGLVDELQLVIAPLFVGDSRARRFVRDAEFPWNPDHRAHLAESRQIGDVVLLRYALSERFDCETEQRHRS